MDKWELYERYAREHGITAVIRFRTELLECEPRIRRLCTPESCTSYGTNWICPPACGDLPQCASRLSRYSEGLFLEKKYLVNTKNITLTRKLAADYNKVLYDLLDYMRPGYPEALLLSTGGCSVCGRCTYPQKPCRRPSRRRGALSSYGIDAAALCSRLGAEYSFTEGILYYIGLILV
mgnify:CR=1 FL=1